MAETKQAQAEEPAVPPAGSSSVELRSAGDKEAQAGQKQAADAARKAEQADEREQERRRQAAEKEGKAELADSLQDPLTGRQVDSSELGLATARTDLLPKPAAAGLSEDQLVKIANRHDDPAKVFAELRGGADPAEEKFRDPATGEQVVPTGTTRAQEAPVGAEEKRTSTK